MKDPNFPDFSKEIKLQELDENYILKKIELEIPQWRLLKSPMISNPIEEQIQLYRRLEFKSFRQVTKFISTLNEVSKILYHHPRLHNMYTSLDIYLSTWALNEKVSMKDILFAKNVDRIYKKDFFYEKQEKIEINPRFKKSAKELIKQGELKMTFQKVNEYFLLNKNITQPKEIESLQFRFSTLESERLRDIIEYEKYNREKNRIVNELLDFLG